MKLKLWQFILATIICFGVGIGGAFVGTKWFESTQEKPPVIEKDNNKSTNQTDLDDPQLEKIVQTLQLIEQHYIEEVEEDDLYEGAIKGILDVLDDPYSEYMNVEAMERFEEQINSSFQGIGAEVSLREGKVTIISPIKDSPAEKAGLRPNDVVLEVDGESLEGYDLHEAVEHIRGEKGSTVTLLIERAGSEKPFEVELVRDDIPVETVYKEMLEEDGKKTGYLTLTSFSERTSTEFEDFLNELEDEGMDGLVIDVRGNPGGLLDSVEEILELLVTKDKPYIQIEDRDGKKEEYFTNLTEGKDYPISIITDEGSASASEILAVTLKENGYDVVGTKSFGKGTVQQAVSLGDGSTVKLTFFKWLSPDGNWINEVGVEPTIEQKQPDYYYLTPVSLDDELKKDDVGEDIETIQKMLKGIGYDDIRTDGYFDEEMEKVVKAYQKDHDLDVTGTINEKTYGQIELNVVDNIREKEDDLQLEKAIEALYN
ncbi:MAG TPA: S41 family peptidase [Pseudogracilibacillus sp.]|nr:S41 family peptidase [Pseudogracilibacillus sp.]